MEYNEDSLTSIMLDVDSYKSSMKPQYPKGTKFVFDYVESRGGVYNKTLFFGLQTFVKRYLMKPITQAQIDFATSVWAAHGVPFPRDDWQYILDHHNGVLPIRIRAVPEGTVIPTGNVLVTVENTDEKCFWLTTWIETSLLRAVWYPTTVATVSWDIKQVIKEYLEKSGDPAGLPFKFHDFGARGVSSKESACLGGAAHLVNFMGTDTISAVVRLHFDYNAPLNTIGFSIPAAEHSTITSWGRDHEEDAYRNMVSQFGKKDAILAVVSDSYDIYKACEMWGTTLKEDVLKSGATVVIRPDSGEPNEILPRILNILEKHYGAPKNTKGYKVLNNVRIIWGDGINPLSLKSILRTMVDYYGWSADNFAFGAGGGLLQKLDRDTQKFAMKCSSVCVREWVEDGDMGSGWKDVWRDVFKDPITDPGKASKRGRMTLYKDKKTGEYFSGVEDWVKDELVTYYEDGKLLVDDSLANIRARSEQ